MINFKPWKEFIDKEFYYDKPELYSDKDENNQMYVAINIITFFITNMINNTLKNYCKTSNIAEEYHKNINMKNEFLYMRMVLASTKKRYIGSIRLREGKEILPEKIDVKGFDFVKSTAPDEIKDYFKSIIKNDILGSTVIDNRKIIREIDEYETHIRESLSRGEEKFLLPRQVKEVGAYKDPFRIQQVKAAMIWNILYPDTPIVSPTNVYLIKVTIDKNVELERLNEKYPDIHDRIVDKIFNNKEKAIAKKFSSIAIPAKLDKIPDWIIEFMDYGEMVNNNISSFYPVLDSLGTVIMKAKGNKEFFTNLIEI